MVPSSRFIAEIYPLLFCMDINIVSFPQSMMSCSPILPVSTTLPFLTSYVTGKSFTYSTSSNGRSEDMDEQAQHIAERSMRPAILVLKLRQCILNLSAGAFRSIPNRFSRNICTCWTVIYLLSVCTGDSVIAGVSSCFSVCKGFDISLKEIRQLTNTFFIDKRSNSYCGNEYNSC